MSFLAQIFHAKPGIDESNGMLSPSAMQSLKEANFVTENSLSQSPPPTGKCIRRLSYKGLISMTIVVVITSDKEEDDDEMDTESIIELEPEEEEIMMRWVNEQLKLNESDRRISNFEDDLMVVMNT
jgi:hypothetical protein